MDMNKTYFGNKSTHTPSWKVIDGTGKVVGRLATEIATILRGKDRAHFTPHADSGDYVVVINADKVVFTGKKPDIKTYEWYTGWIGGLKSLTVKQMIERNPEFVLKHAVKGMLPKNTLSRALIKKLKVYMGSEHPHAAQVNTSKAA